MLKDRLVQVRTLGEEAFERLTHFKGPETFSLLGATFATSN